MVVARRRRHSASSTMLALRCVVLLAAVLTVAAVKQFRSDYEYRANAEGWFKFHKTPTEWWLAELQCYYEGAILASPLNIDVKYKMTDIISHHRNITGLGVHTGINNRHNIVPYTSVEGLLPGQVGCALKNATATASQIAQILTESARMFPDEYGSTAYCMRMFAQGDLLAGSCNDSLPYICYKKLDGEQKLTECGTIDKDYHYDTITGHCYKFHNYGSNWKFAYMTCAAEGGHLAVINSADEAKALRDLFAKYPDKTLKAVDHFQVAFMGFSEWYNKGTWRTVHGESLESAGYATWSAGQPDNQQERKRVLRCGGIFRSGQLDDLACDPSYAFICEKDPITLRL